MDFWVKALAKLHIEGNCKAEEPIACKSCCKDPYGGYIDACQEEDCQTECKDLVWQYASLQADAWSESYVKVNTASCNITYTDEWRSYKDAFSNFTVRISGVNCLRCHTS